MAVSADASFCMYSLVSRVSINGGFLPVDMSVDMVDAVGRDLECVAVCV